MKQTAEKQCTIARLRNIMGPLRTPSILKHLTTGQAQIATQKKMDAQRAQKHSYDRSTVRRNPALVLWNGVEEEIASRNM
jgi:hypothetical protein